MFVALLPVLPESKCAILQVKGSPALQGLLYSYLGFTNSTRIKKHKVHHPKTPLMPSGSRPPIASSESTLWGLQLATANQRASNDDERYTESMVGTENSKIQHAFRIVYIDLKYLYDMVYNSVIKKGTECTST